MHHILYKTTNQLNGRFYVGVHSTENLDDGYLGSGHLIRRAIKKHGSENFIREILSSHEDAASAFEAERELVNERFIQHPLCYNMSTGGCGGMKRRRPFTEKQKSNIRKAHWSTKPNAAEISRKISEKKKGKAFSDEHKAALSANHRYNRNKI